MRVALTGGLRLSKRNRSRGHATCNAWSTMLHANFTLPLNLLQALQSLKYLAGTRTKLLIARLLLLITHHRPGDGYNNSCGAAAVCLSDIALTTI